jgi:hypothetical protein
MRTTLALLVGAMLALAADAIPDARCRALEAAAAAESSVRGGAACSGLGATRGELLRCALRDEERTAAGRTAAFGVVTRDYLTRGGACGVAWSRLPAGDDARD